MKILKISINNIQSLKGVQPEINFSEGILAHAGLYAITGQTGAGKSSILDAITLALYGKINRYGNEKPSSEIITHNQREAFAEVTFEVNTIVYLARWAASFTRTGSINQTDERKLYKKEGDAWVLLAEKVSNVNPEIEKIVGLKYEQFTKSILLAQNNFSAFLKAKPDERAEMLSKITGTQIYEEISKKVFEQAKSFETEINNLRASLNGNILTEEELTAIRDSFEEKEKHIKEIDPKLSQILAEISWLEAIASSKKEIAQHENSLEIVKQHFIDHSVLYQKLESYHKASLIEKDWQAFVQLQKESSKNIDNTQKTKDEIETLNRVLAQITPELAAATQKLEETLKEQTAKKPLIDNAKLSFAAIESTNESLNQNETHLKTAQQHFELQLENLGVQTAQKAQLDAAIVERQKTIESYEKYSAWETEKGAVSLKTQDIIKLKREIELLALDQLQKQISNFDTENSGIAVVLEHTQKAVAALKQEVELLESQKKESGSLAHLSQQKEGAKTNLEHWNKVLEYFLKLDQQNKLFEVVSAEMIAAELSEKTIEAGLSNQKKSRELLIENKNLKQLLASFEEHRQHLKEDEACPLCGSTAHPYAHDLPEIVSKNDFDKQIETVDAEIKTKEKEKEGALKNVARIKEQIKNTKAIIAEIESALVGLQTILKTEKTLTLDAIQTAIGEAEKNLKSIEVQINTLTEINTNYERVNKLLAAKSHALNEIQLVYSAYQTAKKQVEEKEVSIKENFDYIKTVFHLFEMELEDEDLAKLIEIGKKLGAHLNFLNTEKELLKSNQVQVGTLINAISALTSKKESLEENIVRYQKEVALLATKKEELALQFKNETADFELKIPQEEELRLQLKIKIEEEAVNKKKSEKEINLANITNQQKVLEQLLADKTGIDTSFALAKTHLDQKLVENSFENTDQLQEALGLENSAALRTQKLEFENKKQQIEGALQANLEKQVALLATPLTAKSMEELHIEKNVLEQDKTKINQEIGQLKEQIKNNTKVEEENQLILETIKTKDIGFQKWNQLNKMVGSADGKAFKKFAQDFTLSLLVQHANKHLETMFNRYALFKDDTSEEMELQIKDNTFFGEVRNINSLSGGETFLVSLSLALGLSDLASKNTKIRSLFIDEGFGSLDPENLNNALDALEMLRQNDDRQIGIISHVEELKKRITTQIQVKKYTSEFSTIEIVD